MDCEPDRIVGIDLAKRTYQAKAIELSSGRESSWQGSTEARGVSALLKKLRPTDRVGIECCSLAMKWVHIIQTTVGAEVILLNAGQLRIIYQSTKKTDIEDAAKIAWILRRLPVSELPVVAMPSPEEEYWRALVSEQRSKKRARTTLVNRLHGLFVREGIVTIQRKHLSNEANRQKNIMNLAGYTRTEADRICEELSLLECHILDIEMAIQISLKENDLTPMLMSIPGIGPTVAMAFMAYVGDGSRFENAGQVSNYVGLTPRIDSSGESERIGSITKRGCAALRGLMVQAAWCAVKQKAENPLKQKFEELRERRGKGRAIVAIDRRILELMWVVSIRKEIYRNTNNLAWRLKLQRYHINSLAESRVA